MLSFLGKKKSLFLLDGVNKHEKNCYFELRVKICWKQNVNKPVCVCVVTITKPQLLYPMVLFSLRFNINSYEFGNWRTREKGERVDIKNLKWLINQTVSQFKERFAKL